MEIIINEKRRERLIKFIDIKKTEIDPDSQDQIYDLAKTIADGIIDLETGGMLGWDQLGDTNSLHDYIETSMTSEALLDAVIEACEDRLGEEFTDFGMFDF